MAILTDSLSISRKAAYKVVVLPLPVGPQIMINPFASRKDLRIRLTARLSIPRPSKSGRFLLPPRIRITAFSPRTVGIVESRMSIPSLYTIRPSCGLRASAISKAAITFRRLIKAFPFSFRIAPTDCKTPSRRQRMRNVSSRGSA